MKHEWKKFKIKRMSKRRISKKSLGKIRCVAEELPQTDRTERGVPNRLTDGTLQTKVTDPCTPISTLDENDGLDEAIENLEQIKRRLKTIDEVEELNFKDSQLQDSVE